MAFPEVPQRARRRRGWWVRVAAEERGHSGSRQARGCQGEPELMGLMLGSQRAERNGRNLS